VTTRCILASLIEDAERRVPGTDDLARDLEQRDA
jgi:hypothetical protein